MARSNPSSADLVALSERLTDEVWEQGNLELVDDLVADDYVEHNPTVPEPIHGPEGYKENVRRLRQAFPDLEQRREDVLVEDRTVVERVTTLGTHRGPFAGIGPTGSQVEVQSINVLTFADGQLTEMTIQPDTLGMMQQLGVAPEMGGEEA